MLCFFHLNAPSQQPIVPAHAHNDYEHNKPLFLALEYGFISVEADIHLIDGVLYVSHDHPESPASTPTLEDLYLIPLKTHIELHGGYVYPNYHDFFYLMIDIKSAAEDTYPLLRNLLHKYSSIISIVRNDQDEPHKPLKILLSGNRPVEKLLADKIQYAGLDGRPNDLDQEYPLSLMPVVSENYNKYLSWNGNGTPDDEELSNLMELIHQAHKQGRKVRLWASPDNQKVWERLLSLGLGLINTDSIKAFSEFMNEREK